MATINFTQTNTAADDGWSVGDSGHTAGSTTQHLEMKEGATAGSTEVTIDPGVNQQLRACLLFQTDTGANEPDMDYWTGDDWTVRLNVTSANKDLQWRETFLMVRNSGGTWLTVGALQGQTTSMSAGTQTHTLSMRRNWKRTAGDSIGVLCIFYYNNTHGGQSAGITPSLNIDSSIEDTWYVMRREFCNSSNAVEAVASTNKFISTEGWGQNGEADSTLPVVGEKFVTTGFTTGANNGTWTIATVSATEITVEETGIIQDEASGTGQSFAGNYTAITTALVTNSRKLLQIAGTWEADDDVTGVIALGALSRVVIVTGNAVPDDMAPHDDESGELRYRLRRSSNAGDMMTHAASWYSVGMDIQHEACGASDEWVQLDEDGTEDGGIRYDLIDCIIGCDPNDGQDQGDMIYWRSGAGGTDASNFFGYAENCVFYNWDRSVFGLWNNNLGNQAGTGPHAGVEAVCCSAYQIGTSTDSNYTGFVMRDLNTNTGWTCRCFNSFVHMQNSANAPFWLDSANETDETLVVDRFFTNATEVGDSLDGTDWPTQTVTDSTTSGTFTTSTSPGAGDFCIITSTTLPYDLTLQDDTDNDCQDAHADASGAGLTMPSTDLLGTTRPVATNYDIGAYEVPAAALTPGAYLKRMQHMPAPNPLLRM